MKKMGRRITAAALAAVLTLTAAGCRKAEQGNTKTNLGENVKEVAAAEYPEEPVFKTDEERRDARMKKEIPANFHNAYGRFTYDTASALLKEGEENKLYSPLGLYLSLAVAAEGANGETRKEILNVLGYGYAENLSADCKTAFEALYHVPNEANNKKGEGGEYPSESRYSLRIANSLWADSDLDLKKEFAGHAAQYFYADIYQADLSAEETRQAMAQWVKDKTNGVLAPSPAPETSAEETLLSFRNTIYFYDEWMDRFDKGATKEDTFTLADGTEVSCDFMNRTMSSHVFRKGENFTMSTLNLKNSQMIFVLPNPGVDVHALAESPETLKDILEGSDGQAMGEVVWKVPKFSYGSSMELAVMLRGLGIEKAFDDADFSNISDSPLFISGVTQDTHIGIDENGVEAAAFTEIAWAGAALPQGRADMILDRPFLYVIRNRGEVLFLGICENPVQ